MSLNAGEVFVVVGARLDSAAIAKAKTSFDEIKASSDRAQAAADASSSAQRRAMTDYAASAKRGEDATKRLEQSLSRAKDAAILTGKVGALGVAGIATALGGAALAAVGFDSAMRNVNSIAGLSQKQFDALEKQVLRLAPSLGASPKELATGLYDIVSTGFKASDAIKILAVSAKAGKAGLTDTATATDAITSALKAYGIGASGAKGVSDLLFETVDVGKLNFQQLASSIGTVLPTASTLGIPLKQLGAAIATITLNGTDAKTATTQLSSIFTAFQKPTKDLTKVFHDQGYETAAAGLKALGLKGSLDLLRKQVSGGHNTWVDFFKDVRALRGAQGLEGTAHAADLFATSTKAMDGATKGAGATQKAFAEQSKSTAVQFDKLKAGIDVAAITIGSALLPKLNEGITALSHWFLQAEKSGDIDRWANDISGAVNEILNEIHKLGPDAEAAFHVITSTVQAALPFVEKLYEIFQDVEPAIADVVKAGSGLAQVLGPGPILAAVGAFKALQTAGLGAQAGVGKFAKVMQAGSLAIAGAKDGGVVAGKITTIGEEAAGSAGKVRIFATGLAKTIGNPNLIAAGAAGIVLSILYIKSTMTSLKDEAQDVVDALAELQGDRINVSAAKIAKARLDVATKTAGSRAVDLARLQSNDQRPEAIQAAAPTRAEIKATNDLAAANLNVRDAANQRDHAEAVLAAAEGKRAADQTKLAQQLVGAGQKSLADAALAASNRRSAEVQYGRKPSGAEAAATQKKAVDDLVASLRKQFDAETDLDKAGKAAGNRIADVIAAIGKVPDKTQYKIIANDVAAGKSLAKIKRDLGILDKTTATPKINADPTDANRDIDNVTGKANALNALRPQVHLGASGFDGVQAAISSINTNILHLTQNPFTVKINYATSGTLPTGGSSKVNKKPQAAGGYSDKPSIGVWGEDGPEYVIPVGPKYRASGMALWLQAGKDMGVQMSAKGKKPGKTPGPIKRGLGYDPQALDDQQAAEKKRLDDATGYRDSIKGK
jgi:TP901 family phage tail tape measure protein